MSAIKSPQLIKLHEEILELLTNHDFMGNEAFCYQGHMYWCLTVDICKRVTCKINERNKIQKTNQKKPNLSKMSAIKKYTQSDHLEAVFGNIKIEQQDDLIYALQGICNESKELKVLADDVEDFFMRKFNRMNELVDNWLDVYIEKFAVTNPVVITFEAINHVIDSTSCTEDEARAALEKTRGDAPNAVVRVFQRYADSRSK